MGRANLIPYGYVYSYIWYGIYVINCSRIVILGTRQFIQFLSRYASVTVRDSIQTYSNVRDYVIIVILKRLTIHIGKDQLYSNEKIY